MPSIAVSEQQLTTLSAAATVLVHCRINVEEGNTELREKK